MADFETLKARFFKDPTNDPYKPTKKLVRNKGPYNKMVEKFGDPYAQFEEIKDIPMKQFTQKDKDVNQQVNKINMNDHMLSIDINLFNQVIKKLNNNVSDIDILKMAAIVEQLVKNTDKIDQEYEKSGGISLNIYQILLAQGDIQTLYSLSLTNKELKTWLSKRENVKILIHTTNIRKYYKDYDISTFNELYFLHTTINDRIKIYNYIKSTFHSYDFERALEKDFGLVGEYETYIEFMKYQCEYLFSDEIDKTMLKYLTIVTNVGGGFGFVDKETMIEQHNSGLVISANGTICLTKNR